MQRLAKTGEELNTQATLIALMATMTARVFALSPCLRGTSKAEGVKRPVWRTASCALFLLFLLTACEHRPLEDPSAMHYVRVYLDEHLRNVNFGFYDETKPKPEYITPGVVRVTLSDPETGLVITERHISGKGSDERGNYIDGYIAAAPGTYNLLAYNFDTQSTHVRARDDYYGMQVYTNPISQDLMSRLESVRGIADEESGEWNILYEPDHFFVESLGEVEVKDNRYRSDTIYNKEGDHFTAQSVVKTYYMQVNVKGIEYVKSAVSLITGMAGATRMHDRCMIDTLAASVYFQLTPERNSARGSDGVAVAYANFNTFGKLEAVEGYIAVTFEFNTTYGTTQTETIRVTDMFETEQVRDKQWIIIDKVIEIAPPPAGEESTGGLKPGVGEWDEVEGSTTL